MRAPLIPTAVRASDRPGIAPGRYRAAIFAGDNPYSTRVWTGLHTFIRSEPACREARAMLGEVRKGFTLADSAED